MTKLIHTHTSTTRDDLIATVNDDHNKKQTTRSDSGVTKILTERGHSYSLPSPLPTILPLFLPFLRPSHFPLVTPFLSPVAKVGVSTLCTLMHCVLPTTFGLTGPLHPAMGPSYTNSLHLFFSTLNTALPFFPSSTLLLPSTMPFRPTPVNPANGTVSSPSGTLRLK